ncbi:DUF3393 domain-containing protein [Ectothiorhodospiraceae bacterium BW-2]|nr:DUF3393 domain-containing protein [Ectothiorhodospiraceae bacterium BW-2]
MMVRNFLLGLILFLGLGLGTTVTLADAFSDYRQQQQQQLLGYQQQQQQEYERYLKALEEGFAAYKQLYKEEQARFEASIKEIWGDTQDSDRKTWVSYDADNRSRNSVNFESGKVTLELISDGSTSPAEIKREIEKRLTELLGTTEKGAYESDRVAKAVEKRLVEQHKEVVEQGEPSDKKALLTPLVGEKPLNEPQRQQLSKQLLGEATVSIKPNPADKEKKITKVEFDLPPRLEAKVRPLLVRAEEIAAKEEIPLPLIFAVIESESSFNPRAKSHIPAYGLMQIVPNSAGKDATAYLFGKAKVLTPSYLYDSDKNIAIGGAYLHILFYRYLKAVENPTSRLFCTIAAYNTGAGNVARAFTGDSRSVNKAAPMINSLTPQQVYQRLKRDLPYDETRRYIEKVSTRMGKYQGL